MSLEQEKKEEIIRAGDSLRLAREFKRDLLAGEQSTLLELTQAYRGIIARLRPQWEKTVTSLAAATEAGETSPLLVSRRDDLQGMLSDSEYELERYNKRVAQTVQQRQEQLIDIAEANITDLARAVAGEVEFAWAHISKPYVETLVGLMRSGNPAYDLLMTFAPKTTDRMRDAIVSGLSVGQTPDKILKEFESALSGNLAQALTIVRTEDMRAYRETQAEAMKANADVVEAWRWHASLSYGTCAACLSLHGEVFPIEAEMESHPNCLVGGTIVGGPKPLATSTRWYEGRVINIKTLLGHDLTVTPNHPVLTTQGWIAAALLEEGDDIISSGFTEWSQGGNPDNDQVPTRIEEVVQTLGGAGETSALRMPCSPVDFHGDGVGSQVCIIRTNRFLQDSGHSTLGQPGLQFPLISRSVLSPPFTGLRTATELLEGNFAPPVGSSYCKCNSASFFRGAPGNHQLDCLFRGAKLHPGLLQAKIDAKNRYIKGTRQVALRLASLIASNDFIYRQVASSASAACGFTNTPVYNSPLFNRTAEQPASLELIRQSLLGSMEMPSSSLKRLAANVRLDCILKISSRNFSGHVYNLQTQPGWYVANGIVTHNCRCVQMPVLQGFPLEKWETGEEWLRRQPEDIQKLSLGKSKLIAWQNGEISLKDLRGHVHNDVFGPMYVEIGLEAALNKAKGR